MPCAGWVKPESDRRLSDVVSVGLVAKVFPAEVVDEVIAEVGRVEQRRRALPARSVAYFAMGMVLHPTAPGVPEGCSVVKFVVIGNFAS